MYKERIMDKIKNTVVSYNNAVNFGNATYMNFYLGELRGLTECAAMFEIAVSYHDNDSYIHVLTVEFDGQITDYSTVGWDIFNDVEWRF